MVLSLHYGKLKNCLLSSELLVHGRECLQFVLNSLLILSVEMPAECDWTLSLHKTNKEKTKKNVHTAKKKKWEKQEKQEKGEEEERKTYTL